MRTAWIGCIATCRKRAHRRTPLERTLPQRNPTRILIHFYSLLLQAKKHHCAGGANARITARNSLMNSKRWEAAKCGEQAKPWRSLRPGKQKKKSNLFFHF